jgi:hypothetical protein
MSLIPHPPPKAAPPLCRPPHDMIPSLVVASPSDHSDFAFGTPYTQEQESSTNQKRKRRAYKHVDGTGIKVDLRDCCFPAPHQQNRASLHNSPQFTSLTVPLDLLLAISCIRLCTRPQVAEHRSSVLLTVVARGPRHNQHTLRGILAGYRTTTGPSSAKYLPSG